MWKFGYAEPMLLVAAALGAMLPRRVAALWFVVLAYLSAKYDFRTFVLLGLVLAAFSWYRGPAPGSSPRTGRIVALGTAIAGAAVVGYLSLALIGGDYWTSRRATSNAGREAAMEVGWIAISRSPLVGYGSWPESPELATLYRKLTYDALGATWLNPSVGDTVFTPHSQILQAWMEGGVLGAAFFFVLLWHVAKQLPYVLFRRPRDALSAILVYYLATGLLNIFISPFSAPHRVGIAVVAACLVLLAAERARAKGAQGPGMAISGHGPRPALAVRRAPSPLVRPGVRPMRRAPPPWS
jgi:O-antigen ligase